MEQSRSEQLNHINEIQKHYNVCDFRKELEKEIMLGSKFYRNVAFQLMGMLNHFLFIILTHSSIDVLSISINKFGSQPICFQFLLFDILNFSNS